MPSMKRKFFFIIFGVFLFSHAAVATEAQRTDWSKFIEWEPWKKPAVPEGLKALNKKLIRMPGFMRPLEATATNVSEFLFVPSLEYCQHVPPPPPNLTIHVKMKKGKKAKLFVDTPIWVTGKLSVLENKKIKEGEALFELEGTVVEEYQ
jgi:hypothetical protein